MAKNKDKPSKYPYPSRFGSSSSMVVREEDGFVYCVDEYGEYKTAKCRLDDGLADPNRTSIHRLGKLFEGKKEKNG